MQAEYDDVLRDAKLLRLDLGSEEERCRTRHSEALARDLDLQNRSSFYQGSWFRI